MTVSISHSPSKGIAYTSQLGRVGQQDRERAIVELAQLTREGCCRLLVDGRDEQSYISGDESKALLGYAKEAGLNFKKIAIVEPQGRHPYIMLISDAFFLGVDIQEFTCIQDAEAWLLRED
jgi:hypothetical protein